MKASNHGKSKDNQQAIALLYECLSLPLQDELWRKYVVDEGMNEEEVTLEEFDGIVQDFLDSIVSRETFSEAILQFGKDLGEKLFLDPTNLDPAGKCVTYCAKLQSLLADAGIAKEVW